MENLNEAINRLEKPFDQKFIGVISDNTANGICNNIQGFHGSAKPHFVLQDLGKESVDQDDLNKIGKSDFGEGCHKAKTQCGKYAQVQYLINAFEHEPVFMVFFSRPQEHIRKKCPINGQYLTEYF